MTRLKLRLLEVPETDGSAEAASTERDRADRRVVTLGAPAGYDSLFIVVHIHSEDGRSWTPRPTTIHRTFHGSR